MVVKLICFRHKKITEVNIVKTDQQTKIKCILIGLMSIIGLFVCTNPFNSTKELKNKIDSTSNETANVVTAEETKNENTPEIVYDGLTLDELADKLNRSLNSDLSGYGYQFASKSIELGLDPYLAVAIVLHETGCSWECSDLVKACYNVGGQKGAPGCWGGSYQAFNSMEEGINSYLENLYYNYVAQGLTTPEQINSRYAASQTWASKIYYYIDKIRAT